jgi:hypothetical protein
VRSDTRVSRFRTCTFLLDGPIPPTVVHDDTAERGEAVQHDTDRRPVPQDVEVAPIESCDGDIGWPLAIDLVCDVRAVGRPCIKSVAVRHVLIVRPSPLYSQSARIKLLSARRKEAKGKGPEGPIPCDLMLLPYGGVNVLLVGLHEMPGCSSAGNVSRTDFGNCPHDCACPGTPLTT